MESGKSLVCVLCQRSEENEITGTLSTKQDVTAHHHCLLYSSGLFCRESPQFDDLFGFTVSDVLKEIQRGRKLSCNKCKKKGATVGCENKRCKKSFHYPCAIQAGAHMVDDKKAGSFGLYCRHCKQTKLGLPDDSNSSSASTHPKRKLDFNGQQEEKKAHKRSRIIVSDDSDSDITDAGEEIPGFAPLESDVEDASSAPNELVSNAVTDHIPVVTQNPDPIGPGTSSDFQRENQDRAENERALVMPSSEANSEQSLLLVMEAADVSLDSSNFWRDCVSAGCTQAIFSDFIREMTDIFTRITSGQASDKDFDVAFKVMMVSGKLEALVTKQQEDIQTKLRNLQQATAALNRVASFLQI